MKMYQDVPSAKANQFSWDVFAGDEQDVEFRDFIESISLTREELGAFLAAPELSIEQARQFPAGRQ